MSAIPVPYSSSFLDYLAKEPGVRATRAEKADKAFVYLYIGRNQYDAIIAQRYLGSRSEEGFALPHRRPEKQILPPNWSRAEVAKVQKLFDDPEVKFVAFPMVLLGKYSKYIDPQINTTPEEVDAYFIAKTKNYKPSNDGSHSLVLLYNKQTREVDVLDSDYGVVKRNFHYEKLVDTGLPFFIGPILKTFGAAVERVHLPRIYEPRFGGFKDLLKSAGLPQDFSVMYKAFMASYIHMRTEDIATPGAELAKKVVPLKTAPQSSIQFLIQQYIDMSKAIGEDPRISKLIPTSTKDAVRFEFSRPCPENYVRDFRTGDCVPAEKDVQNRLQVVEAYPAGKHFYPERSSKWLTLIFRYWTDKYKNLAVMIPKHTYNPHPYYYAIQYNYVPRRQSAQTHMNFSIPPDFYDFVDLSMSDPEKRFIGVIVGIDFQGKHANPLIIDKVTRTVERIEVNAPLMDYRFGYNDQTLDEQLQALFEKDPRLESYKLKYIPAMAACPFGLHRSEFIEPSFDVPDIPGRCFEWSLFYIELRVSNPTIDSDKVYSYALEKIQKTGSIKHFIYGYIDYTVKQSRSYRLKDYNRKLHPVLSVPKKDRLLRLEGHPRGSIVVSRPTAARAKANSAPPVVIPTWEVFLKKLKRHASV